MQVVDIGLVRQASQASHLRFGSVTQSVLHEESAAHAGTTPSLNGSRHSSRTGAGYHPRRCVITL